MLLRAIATGKGVEDLAQANGEECVGLELLLVAQQMQFHQQLVSRPPVERRNDIRESVVKSPLAVGNGQMLTQVRAPKQSELDLSAAEDTVRIPPIH